MTPEEAKLLKKTISNNDRIALLARPLQLSQVAFKQPRTLEAKPHGLWYGCGSEWIDWLIDETPEKLAEYHYAYRLMLNFDRVLRLRTDRAVNNFDTQYGVERAVGLTNIDWSKVAAHYDGIEICPYQEKSTRYIWYYTWDVASGAFWDPAAISSTEMIFADHETSGTATRHHARRKKRSSSQLDREIAELLSGVGRKRKF